MIKYFAAVLLFLLSLSEVPAATLVVSVTQDTYMHELFDDSNFGGSTFLAAGAIRSENGFPHLPRVRALIRFDLAGKVPAGATITSAKVLMSVTFKPSVVAPGSTFTLHRMLRNWGEGTKSGVSGGLVGQGEASWGTRQAPTGWDLPGASGQGDAILTVSSSVAMDAVARYTFPSSATLVADVQGWLNNPASNFGWMMKTGSESTSQTARRFGSKESGANASALEIEYTVPATPPEIIEFRRTTEGMFLSWTGGNPPYRVQRADAVLGPWEFVTAASSATSATAPFGGDIAYYRVAAEAP